MAQLDELPTIDNDERPCAHCGRAVEADPSVPDDQVMCREAYFELAESELHRILR